MNDKEKTVNKEIRGRIAVISSSPPYLIDWDLADSSIVLAKMQHK